jgi:hypothetical protein
MKDMWRGRVSKDGKQFRVMQRGLIIVVVDRVGTTEHAERHLVAGYNRPEVETWLRQLGYTIETLE